MSSSNRKNPKVTEARNYADFRELAQDATLSRYEKIGFPDAYRAGHEAAIVADIVRKLPAFSETGRTIVDIGAGCSDVPAMLIDLCQRNNNRYVAVDSAEMLALLPEHAGIVRIEGPFPDCAPAIAAQVGAADAILCYSVFQYIFTDSNPFDFIDRCILLLAPGGRMLIGDIPNHSMRQRFFSSAAGIAFHRQFTGRQDLPETAYNRVEAERIDDAVVLGMLARARAAGVDAYVMPQDAALPMANRREDILLVKP